MDITTEHRFSEYKLPTFPANKLNIHSDLKRNTGHVLQQPTNFYGIPIKTEWKFVYQRLFMSLKFGLQGLILGRFNL